MKAVQELVAYFDRRGRLSKRHVRHLLDQGYLAAEAPASMLELHAAPGTTFYFRIRGATEGPLWGTDVYTGDSALSVAAVHAGLVKPDQTTVLRVTVVEPPAQYPGSLRHGVTSHDFGRYGSAYRLSAI